MSDDLDEQLERDEALWQAWCAHGVTESTPLTVDFNFYATNEEAANSLAAALHEAGLDEVEVRATRTLLIFKGWKVWGVERGMWSLERLQDRTRVFCGLAASYHSRMEGCGAMMPDEDDASPDTSPPTASAPPP